jgi:hypothetical protein
MHAFIMPIKFIFDKVEDVTSGIILVAVLVIEDILQRS